jgi:HK97 family phage major capsid protein
VTLVPGLPTHRSSTHRNFSQDYAPFGAEGIIMADATQETLLNEWSEFKKANDERLKAIESKGYAPADLEAKVEKLNAAVGKLDAARTEQEKKLARLNTPMAGEAEGTEKVAQERKAFFNGYMRNGVERLSADERKALVVSSDTGGGYLAPFDFVAEIIKAEVLFSPMRELVRVRPTSRGSVVIPKRTGTAAAAWVGESETRVESTNPTWGSVEIPTHEMYAECRVSFADLEDSAFDLEALLRDEFAEQFGVAEGAAIVSGNGVKKPLGFLDANAAGPSVPVAYTASGYAATIAGAAAGSAGQGDGLINLFHAVKSAYARNGKFLLNRSSLGAVRKLKDTTGAYLWQPGVNGAAQPTILGAPYVEVPDMPDEGSNAFAVAFGDWQRAITLVDRVEMSIGRDPFTVASAGQVKFTARKRIGAQVVLGEAIRLLKCAAS